MVRARARARVGYLASARSASTSFYKLLRALSTAAPAFSAAALTWPGWVRAGAGVGARVGAGVGVRAGVRVRVGGREAGLDLLRQLIKLTTNY